MRKQTGRALGSTPIGVIDIGTSKICCLILGEDVSGEPILLGFGQQRSQGIKAGVVSHQESAEVAIRTAVAQAERMAGLQLNDIAFGVSCGRLVVERLTARAEISGTTVSDGDLERVLSGAEAYLTRQGRIVIHRRLGEWQLDGQTGIVDPRGNAGHELAVLFSAVTADEAPIRNLVAVIDRCHLETRQIAASAHASAIAVTTPDERRAGVLVVDIGGGATGLAAFADDNLLHLDVIRVGGEIITYDIAQALVTSLIEAERMKTLHGSLAAAASDSVESIPYRMRTESGSDQNGTAEITRQRLRELIEPRIDAIGRAVTSSLAERDLAAFAEGRVVLTGGGAELAGLDRYWSHRFTCEAIIGRPRSFGGMQAAPPSPAFATVMGLALMSRERRAEPPGPGRTVAPDQGYLRRVHRWWRESF